ncbi:DNA-binding transcriptional regulator YbjK [Kibdelosporangium banguiense]|uniref:DNA-binding transcriptional regulator YbjK n=1 Tax=Kibdelosporangium banguiense TaxID=1365924 RepID=A0ABS4TDL2_9PSEU|nr:TetR family transcriptional regulator [Kibdelosporangium banguiense]MBP2322074.1 DNA-binding transcriptional regulator YbjK [Kibdelosporangium banguiense]
MTAASTPKGERRRQALVEAAAQLLAEGGFDAIRHRAVADRAGLPLASTTYYFDSLDELITAAAEYQGWTELGRGRRQLEAVEEEKPGFDQLVELVLDQLLGVEPESGDAEAVLLRYERLVATGRRPYLRPVMRAMAVELHSLLADIFTRCGMPLSKERIEQVIALVDGAVVNALLEIHSDPRATARRMLRTTLTQ